MILTNPVVHVVLEKTADSPDQTLPLAWHIGLVAPIALLAGYALLTAGVLTAKHYTYQWLNVVGAAALTYTVIKPWNGGVFVTELIWTLIGVFGVWKIWSERKGGAAKTKEPRVK